MASATPGKADCDRPRSSATAVKQSEVIFRGAVREIEMIDPIAANLAARSMPSRSWCGWPGWHGWIVTLDVSRVWKGRVGQRVVLHIAQIQEDDAFESFERGLEYLVLPFATRH